MGDSQAAVTRHVRRFVAASVCFLVVWQVAALAAVPRRATVRVAVFGFVLHAVFGQAYSLVPAYFDRELSTATPLAVQIPASALGAILLAAGVLVRSAIVRAAGAVLWCAGVAVFVGTLLWTVRGNPTGAETGTGDHDAHRYPVDRLSNAFVPVALAYLLVGSYETLAAATAVPTLVGAHPAVATHLLAAGTGALLVFAVGFRLLPRLLVAAPPRPLVRVVLPAGAAGPALLALGVGTSSLALGAAVQSVAVVGFALAVVALLRESERTRVGRHGVLLGAAAGIVAVALGVHFATVGPVPSLVAAHARLNLLGFLGLTIVGVSYQFYPPAVVGLPGAGDRAAAASIWLLAAGLALELLGRAVAVDAGVALGRLVTLAGSLLVAYHVLGAFRTRAAR